MSKPKSRPAVDGRSSTARRFRQLCKDFAADIGEGNLTAADRLIIANAAAMATKVEQIQTAMLCGEMVKTDELTRLSHASARLLQMLYTKDRKSQPKHKAAWEDQ